jgi:hypothetical protein
MRWKLAWVVVAVTSFSALAQSPCESKCNQQASECLKACSGDPKEASKPDHAQKLLACLSQCDVQAKPCRESCKK